MFNIYIFILCSKNIKKHVKIISIRDQKQNQKLYMDENILFYFLETKINFDIFLKTKNLFNPTF